MGDLIRYETSRLGDVDDSYYFGVSCPKCFRAKRLSLTRLKEKLGEHYLIKDVRRHLRCKTCGNRGVTVGFFIPAQAVGNLSELFEQAAE